MAAPAEGPPPLPPLPEQHDHGLPEARGRYLTALIVALEGWARWRLHAQPSSADARRALVELELYGLWGAAATARAKHWWTRLHVYDHRPDGMHQHTSALRHWFWEWMHLRHHVAVLDARGRGPPPPDEHQSSDAMEIGDALDALQLRDDAPPPPTIRDFPFVLRARLGVLRPGPIATWTQSELSDALTALLLRWQTLPWHPDLNGYVHALLDRVAALGWAPFSDARVLDQPDFRTRHVHPRSGRARYTPNLDWEYRHAHRVRHLLRALYLQLEAGERLAPAPGTLELPPTAPRPVTAAQLQAILEVRARTAGPDTLTVVQKEASALSVGPDDAEWLRYLKPTSTIVPSTIIEELHESYKARLQRAAWRRPHELVALLHSTRTADTTERGLAERVALRMLDGALPAYLTARGDLLNWSQAHAFPNGYLEESKLLRRQRELPYLVQWQGRYELVWRGRTFDHVSLYDALADWFWLVSVHYPGSHVWQSLGPALAEIVARHKKRVAEAAAAGGELQDDADGPTGADGELATETRDDNEDDDDSWMVMDASKRRRR